MTEPSGEAAIAVPPEIAPEEWETHEGFRETTLAAISDPDVKAAARLVGRLFYSMALQFDEFEQDSFFDGARAVVADLRFLEGWLGWKLGRAHEYSELSPEEARLSRGCAALAVRLRKIADTLERKVGAAEEASTPERC